MNDKRHCDDQVLIECDLPEPPEKVWRALTEPKLVAEWLGPEEGKAESAREIIEAKPNERLRYRWRDRERDESGAKEQTVESFVTFELSQTPDGGTHLRLIHSDFAIVATVTAHGMRASGSKRPPMATAIVHHSWRRAA